MKDKDEGELGGLPDCALGDHADDACERRVGSGLCGSDEELQDESAASAIIPWLTTHRINGDAQLLKLN